MNIWLILLLVCIFIPIVMRLLSEAEEKLAAKEQDKKPDIFEMIRKARDTKHNHNCECCECAPFIHYKLKK